MEAGSIQHEAVAWEMDRADIVGLIERAMVADGRIRSQGMRPSGDRARNGLPGPDLQPGPAFRGSTNAPLGSGTTTSPPFVPWVGGRRQALRRFG